ncbi:MAG: LysR family transcriptional regulator [Alteromonadaceae bacterium]|nr:LysR family transcriptional regulator [Alteromonadaceae bacterium]
MQWQGINEFVAVTETESFTQAAKQLKLSTAQVSRQVSTLEKRLNIKLLYRTTRKVSLTQEGNVFYQHCRSVLDGLEAAERAITHLQSKPQGKIKLTAPVTYGELKILPLVNDFLQQYPNVEVSAYLSNKRIDLIDQGYDLAIRLGKLNNSSMMAKKLSNRKTYVCASPNYIKLYGSPHSLSELTQHNCLMGSLDFWRFNENGQERNIRVRGRIRYNSGFSLVDAALKGLGLVQLPDYYVASYIAKGNLITVLDKFSESDEGVWAVYPHNRQLSPKIRLLVDHLSQNIPLCIHSN